MACWGLDRQGTMQQAGSFRGEELAPRQVGSRGRLRQARRRTLVMVGQRRWSRLRQSGRSSVHLVTSQTGRGGGTEQAEWRGLVTSALVSVRGEVREGLLVVSCGGKPQRGRDAGAAPECCR